MIGASTGQVVSYAIRCKKCKQCDQKNGKDHDWRRNWSGSSKSIESDIAVEMLHKMKEQGFHVKNLVMDNDSTTITRAKSSFGSSLKKISDFNYTKKNFTSKLYDIKKQKQYTLLGPKTIKHLTKCFAYVVKSNSDNAKLKKNIESTHTMSLESMKTVMNGANLKKPHKLTNQNIFHIVDIWQGKSFLKI